VVEVDGELAEDFAGGGVDGGHVEVLDQEFDVGSGVGSADADVSEFAGAAIRRAVPRPGSSAGDASYTNRPTPWSPEGDIDESAPRSDIGEVGHPPAVRDPSGEIAVEETRGPISMMLARAQKSGQAHSDIALADIVNLIWSNGRMMDATSTTAPKEWRRHLYLMLDAYRAERASDPRAAHDRRAALRRHRHSRQGQLTAEPQRVNL